MGDTGEIWGRYGGDIGGRRRLPLPGTRVAGANPDPNPNPTPTPTPTQNPHPNPHPNPNPNPSPNLTLALICPFQAPEMRPIKLTGIVRPCISPISPVHLPYISPVKLRGIVRPPHRPGPAAQLYRNRRYTAAAYPSRSPPPSRSLPLLQSTSASKHHSRGLSPRHSYSTCAVF